MRAYYFGNMYLSSIQQGIQAAHVTHELFLKYPSYNPNHDNIDSKSDILHEWVRDHKTMILLNGGYAENLRQLTYFFNRPDNTYPWTTFHESDEAADGLLTSVGIILPEKIYETAKELRDGNIAAEQIPVRGEWSPKPDVIWELSKWEYELCRELNNYDLAS